MESKYLALIEFKFFLYCPLKLIWQNNFMKFFLLHIIFLSTLFFAENANSYTIKNLPLLEKDLYLKGSNLFFNDLSERYFGFDFLIRLYNDYDSYTKSTLESCKSSYRQNDFQCLREYEKTQVNADVYVYLTDELKLNRNRFLKRIACDTSYYGDGNEFISILIASCISRSEGSLDLNFGRFLIQRDTLQTSFYNRSSINNIKEVGFINQEEYKKNYQQLDEKHQEYLKKIEGEALL